ncbi:FG-GAP-like repeat-containing protein [Myxococcota bacterium]|nr:FG-GAP-like repeat-containing protein [Myxococcota bacterium]
MKRSALPVALALAACSPSPEEASTASGVPSASTSPPSTVSAPVSAPSPSPASRARERFRARALLESQRFTEAAAAFDALLAQPEATPEDAAGRLLSGLLGAPDTPIEVPPGVRPFEGRTAAVAYLLGHAARRSGDAAGALAAFERAHAMAPEAPEARYFLAVNLAERGRGAEALVHFDALAGVGARTGTLHGLPAMYRAATLAPPAERAARLAAYERAFHERGQPAAPDELLFHGSLTALDFPPPPRGAGEGGDGTPPPVFAPRAAPALPGDLVALAVTWPAGIAGPPVIVGLNTAGLVAGASPGAPGHAPPRTVPARATGVIAADADADGDADFGVFGPRPALVAQDATPGPPVLVPGAGPAEGGLAGDLDHDGDTDWLFVSRSGPPTVWRALGPGVGRLAVRHGVAPDALGLVAARGAGAAMIYADDDPRVDVLIYGPALRLYRADRPGAFVDTTRAAGLADAGRVDLLVVVDLDADGRFDVVVADGTTTRWHRNLGGLRFGPARPLAAGATALVEADLDSDGFVDVLVSGPARPPELCRGGDAAPSCAPLTGLPPLARRWSRTSISTACPSWRVSGRAGCRSSRRRRARARRRSGST